MRKLTTEEFVEKAKVKHGDYYDYSKSVYVNAKTPLIITCPKHGDFEQKGTNHLSGYGCSKCGVDKTKGLRNTTEEVVARFKEVHGDFYDYSKYVYKGYYEKSTITCPIHGDFEQTTRNHLRGGCRKCSNEDSGVRDIVGTINTLQDIHGDGYVFSPEYFKKFPETNNNYYIKVTCEVHGEWEARIAHLKEGKGCPKCAVKTSGGETEVDSFIHSLGFTYDKATTGLTENNTNVDTFIPSKNIAIEYNGLYWHSSLFKDPEYHVNKTIDCQSKGVRLIHIFEDEWLTKPEIVKSRLRNILGCNEVKIYARKCVVKELTNKEVRLFLNENHIQGYVNAKVSLGLFYNDELVSLMTFGSLRKNLGQTAKEDSWELLRFCNKLNTSVIGGASKLLTFFEKRFKPKMVLSYADRRWSEGGLYKSLGFEFEHLSQPNYFYVKNGVRENRFKYRKSELVKQGHDPSKSEKQIMDELGYLRIYDCGAMRFVKNY